MSELRPTLLAYTTKELPEFDKFRVTYTNPIFFNRPSPVGKYEYIYVDADYPHVAERYKLENHPAKIYELGAPAKRTPKAIESQIAQAVAESSHIEVVEDEADVATIEANKATKAIPDDYESLPWPQLRSLAASLTDEKITSKDKALEVLAANKGA